MSIDVLNIPLFDKKRSFAVLRLIEICQSKEKRENRLISATGAHGMVTSKLDNNFADLLHLFYWNLPDGTPGVWMGRSKGAKGMERCYGPDFFADTIIATANSNIQHFFCGGKEGVADELKKVCKEKFHNSNIVGIYSPSFEEMTDSEMKLLAEEINSKKTDIVWIGLSTPKQEIFAHRLSKYTNVHFLCTVGAAFDFHIGAVRQASPVLQKMGLEWLFRLIMEPRRLFGRYLVIVPLFLYYGIMDILAYKLKFKKRSKNE